MLNAWPRWPAGSPAGTAERCRGGGNRLPGAGTLRADEGCAGLPERDPAAEGADGGGRAGDPDAAGSRHCGAVREQHTAQWRDGGADQAPGGAGDRGLGARAVGPRPREPGLRGGPGWGLQERRQPDLPSAASALSGLPGAGLGETGWSSGSWTPPTCPPGPPVPRRACWWPGAMTRPGSECGWARCWASGNGTRAGDGPRPSS